MPLQNHIFQKLCLKNFINLYLHTVLECKNSLYLLSHLLLKIMLERQVGNYSSSQWWNRSTQIILQRVFFLVKRKKSWTSKREKKNHIFKTCSLSHNFYSLPLPFGVISATKSSTVTCSSPFSLITSYAKAKNKSYHLKSLSVRKIFIEEGLRSCFYSADWSLTK